MKSFDKWMHSQGKEPSLGDIILDICGGLGINRADVDVSDLDVEVEGLVLSNRDSAPCTCGRTTVSFVYIGEAEHVTYEHHQCQKHSEAGG